MKKLSLNKINNKIKKVKAFICKLKDTKIDADWIKSIETRIKNIKIDRRALERFIKGTDKVLVLEVGSQNIKMIEMIKEEKIEIMKGFIVPTPKNSIEEDKLTDTTEIFKIIREKMKEEKILTRDLVVSVSSKDIITRELSLPTMKKEDMDRVVTMNSDDLFPVKLETYSLGYSIIDEYREKGELQNRIIVAAIPNEIIVPYIALAEELKLRLKGFNFSGYELYNLINFEIENKFENFAVLDIGAKNTNFIIVSNGVLKFNRVIRNGSDKINELIMKSIGCDYAKAEKLKRMYNSVIVLGNLKSDSEVYLVAKIMQKVIEEIIQELYKIIEFYNSSNPRRRVSRIYITGIASRISGIEEYMEGITGVQVTRIKWLSKVSFGVKARRLKSREITLINCLGAENLTGRHFVFLKGNLKLSNVFLLMNPKLYKIAICLVLLVLLLASAINFDISLINSESNKYQDFLNSKSKISELQKEIAKKEALVKRKEEVISSIPSGVEGVTEKLDLVEKVIDNLSGTVRIVINKYDFKTSKSIELRCSASKAAGTPEDYVIYMAPYDFETALEGASFNCTEPGANPEDFSITISW